MASTSPPTAAPLVLGERRARLVAACAWLGLAVLLAFPCFAAYGYSAYGGWGVAAAAVAAAVCGSGALCALVLAGLVTGPQAVSGTLGGMFFRVGFPLVAVVLLPRMGGPLVEAGAAGMVMAFYLVTLPVETLLSVRLVAQAGKGEVNHG